MRATALLLLGHLLCACGPPAQAPSPTTRIFNIDARTTVPRVALPAGARGELALRVTNAASTSGSIALHLWDAQLQRVVGSTRDAGAISVVAATDQRLEAIIIGPPDGAVEFELTLDGKLLTRGRANAAWQAVPSPTHSFEAARVAGERGQLWLYAVDETGALLSMDLDSGEAGAARLHLPGTATHVVAGGATEDSDGSPGFRIYANDASGDGHRHAQDRDGDGLGRLLEAALGTCDAVDDAACIDSPLRDYYRTVKHATRDTDRDGLGDRDELLGVAARPPLDLPAWGADPRHKDVFIEVDHQQRAGGHGLDPQDLADIAALYARGSATALRNPDGKNGVRLHMDVGFEPTTPEHRGLFGDWGGAGPVRGKARHAIARLQHFDPARKGYFRYALARDRGTGQAIVGGDGFEFNRHFHRVLTFAHELGHTLGLRHYGHRRLGDANCKPHYLSIMNYAYQKQPGVGFYAGAPSTLNPAQVVETDVAGLQLERLRQPPFELDATAAGVDWNRDGRISSQPVRAAVNWATHKGCNALGRSRLAITTSVAAASPRLVARGDGVLALWIDPAGRVMAARGTRQPANDDGMCPTGTRGGKKATRATRTGTCMAFADAVALSGLPDATGIAAAGGGPDVHLTITTADGKLTIARIPAGTGALAATDVHELPGARSHRPAALHMDAISGTLRLLWLDAGSGGALLGAVRTSGADQWIVRPALEADGTPISAGLGPSLVAMSNGQLCGVFPDAQRFIRLHCLDARSTESPDARWTDLSGRAFYSGLGPITETEASIAFQPYLSANGAPLDDDHRGALHVGFTQAEARLQPNNPRMLVSEWLDARLPVAQRIHFRWRGTLVNEWSNLAPNTSLAMHAGVGTAGLSSLMVTDLEVKGDYELVWLPTVDGGFDMEMTVDNDFAIMERGICTGLRGGRRCGREGTGAY